jgi:hypothetical protein
MPRFNEPGDTNEVTAGCSPMPYRDDLFGPDYTNSVFICEPAHNLIHREVLQPDGVSFKSHRATSEQTNEFLSSTDNWFRPVYLKTGPDGALYVADMYRLVIEHPEYIPRGMQSRYDLRAGHDKGRIYRIYPANAKLRLVPRFDKMSTTELVAALDSPNGWQRDTAQRLLVHGQDKSAIGPLENLISTSQQAKTRLQALCTLDGLNPLTPEIVERGLSDPHPSVREQAVRLSEGFLRKPESPPALTARLLDMMNDPEIRVRFQLALSLGEWKDSRVGQALGKLALKDGELPAMQIAIMSSAPQCLQELAEAVFVNAGKEHLPAGMVEQLMGLGTTIQDRKAFEIILTKLAEPGQNGGFAAWQTSALAGFLDNLDARGKSLSAFRDLGSRPLKETIDKTSAIFAQARSEASNPRAKEEVRVLSIRLLGRGLDQQTNDIERLGSLLFDANLLVQQAALDRLRHCRTPGVAETLILGWPRYLPEMRLIVLSILTGYPEWTDVLLTALENGTIPSRQIGVAAKESMLKSGKATIQIRAQKLFFHNRPEP